MDRIWKFSLLMVSIILLDQLTKVSIQSNFSYGDSLAVIEGLFNITYVRNTGGAFGLFAGAGDVVRDSLFLVVPVLACLWLIGLIWIHRNTNFLSGLTYTLILSGAIGNLIDRFAYGYVVDFLDFYWNGVHFPAFNVADSSISIGGALLVFDILIQWKRERKKVSG